MDTMQIPAPTGKPVAPQPPTRRLPEGNDDSVMTTMLPPIIGAIVGIIIMVVVGIVLVGQAGGLAALGSALIGAHSAWYLSRATAFVSYVLVWWSMILGLSMTNKLARIWPGGPTANALHEHASLLGLAFAAIHALVLLADQYIGYTLPQILIPFASSYMPLWIGFGQIGLYLMAIVTFSFYIRRWIGTKTWRTLHFLSFALFVMALGHGLITGTDSSALWAIVMYAGTGLSVLWMTVYRIFVTRETKAALPAAA